MSILAVLSAAAGAPWESRLLAELDETSHGVQIVRRCVDVVDLLAVAGSGQGQAALVSASLRRLDADAVERLGAAGVAVVAVLDDPVDDDVAEQMRALGVRHLVSASAHAQVIATAIQTACAHAAAHAPGQSRSFALSTAAVQLLAPTPEAPIGTAAAPQSALGAIVAVWGPTGGPGRSTVALSLAHEVARAGRTTILADADVYGGTIAPMMGLLDESPGIAAAARQAANGRLDQAVLAGLCWAVEPNLRVLTGLPRADRWPELRPSAIERVLAVCRSMADFTIVDLGFCLEADEELSFDTAAPRRNGATLAVLDEADVVLAVGAADAVGIARLVRGLDDLKEAQVGAPVWIVLNRVRPSAVHGAVRADLAGAVQRFAGQPPAAYLPLDHAGLDAAILTAAPIARAAAASPFRAAIAELAMALTGSAPGAPQRNRWFGANRGGGADSESGRSARSARARRRHGTPDAR